MKPVSRCVRNPLFFSLIRRFSRLKTTVVPSPGLSVRNELALAFVLRHDGGLKAALVVAAYLFPEAFFGVRVSGACLYCDDGLDYGIE